MDCRAVVAGEAAQWNTLKIFKNSNTITPRSHAIMAPIGTSSIIIAGGYKENRGGSPGDWEYEGGCLGDWVILETVKK